MILSLSSCSFVLFRAWQQEPSCRHVGRKHFQITEIEAKKITIVNSLPQGETGSGQKKPRSNGHHVDHHHIGCHQHDQSVTSVILQKVFPARCHLEYQTDENVYTRSRAAVLDFYISHSKAGL